MTKKLKVLFLENPEVDLMRHFEASFECIFYQVTTLEKCIRDFQDKLQDVEAIYCGWAGFAPIGGFRGKLITYAPKGLKVVTTCSIGVDHFDVQELGNRGILLTNVPSESAFEAVSDLVLYNTIASFRNFKIYEQNFNGELYSHTGTVRTSLLNAELDQVNGKPLMKFVPGFSFGEACCKRPNLSPRNHHVVIVGFGNIGRLIGVRLACIGMKIHYVKRKRLSLEEEKSLGYQVQFHASIEETKKFADLIIVACPGSPSTRHMIDKKLIDTMEKPFRIINIGRGSIVDENALVSGLEEGKILFAGLDVFEQEPKVDPRLFNRQDVILTPHIGSSVIENYKHTAEVSLNNIEAVLFGFDKPLYRVN